MDEQDLDGLARQWLAALRMAHLTYAGASERYESRGRTVGIFTVIISTVVGTGIFVSFNVSIDPFARIGAGLLSLTAAVLSAVHTFLDYPQLSERHRVVAVMYAALRRELEQIIISKGFEKLAEISKKWSKVEDVSPPIPQSLRRRIVRKINLGYSARVSR